MSESYKYFFNLSVKLKFQKYSPHLNCRKNIHMCAHSYYIEEEDMAIEL